MMNFCAGARMLGVTVATGVFQAMMSVELVNEAGHDPLDSKNLLGEVPSGKFLKRSGNCGAALRELRSLGEQRNIDGMARYGIRAKVVYGVAEAEDG